MDKTPNLKTLFGTLQQEMIAKAKFSEILNHPSDKGDNSESNWTNWFKEYLPQRYKVAKATIIDCEGNISDQIDLVLYDAQYSYLAFHQKDVLYIPAESVYAVFEIKPCMNKQYMEYAGEKAESVRKLHRTSAPIPYAGGTYSPKVPHRILSGILANKSEWKEPFGEPFRKCLAGYSDLQRLDCGCVLDAGTYFYDYDSSQLSICSGDESLVFFFLKLLILLQKMGTVPAIDLNEYMKVLKIQEEFL